MTPVAVLASGRGSNLAALMAHARSGNCSYRIACVISDKPGAGALELAREAGIPAFVVPFQKGEIKQDFEIRILQHLQSHQVQVVVLAGYMRILGMTLLEAYPGRILNIHPGLLPAFPGLHAQAQAHRAGVRVAGCTVHLVDSGMDTGPILDQAWFRVPPGISEGDLSARILEHEHRLYPATLHRFCRREFLVEDGSVRLFSPGAGLRSAWEWFAGTHFMGSPPAGRHSTVAVSACLCGFPCRYDGRGRLASDLIRELLDLGQTILPVCPEVLAGFGVPRPKVEFRNEVAGHISHSPMVVDEKGQDVSCSFMEGVRLAANWCAQNGVSVVFLKENSPSCGILRIPWKGDRIPGPGPLCLELEKIGVRCFSSEHFQEGLAALIKEAG